MKPFESLVVVEVAGSMAGGYTAKLFADRGAQVRLVDRPGHAADNDPDPLEVDAVARFLHHRKHRSDDLPAALAGADVIIESSATAPLPPPLDLDAAPGCITVRISPFGSSGEAATWRSSDLTDYARSGHQLLYGHPDRPPLAPPPNQPAFAAGQFAFIGALTALLRRDALADRATASAAGGTSATVEVSHLEAMVALHQFTLLRRALTGDILRRMGNRFAGQGQPNHPFRCADGWVTVTGVTEAQVEGLLAVSGLDSLLAHPDITSPMDFQSHPDLLDPPLRAWFAEREVAETVELLQAVRVPAAPALAPLQLLEDPQLAARHWWEYSGELQLPGPPVRLSGHQWGNDANASRSETAARPDPAGRAGMKRRSFGTVDRPLAGLRVLDLTRVWAGPLATRVLADLGAEVIMVEAPWSRGATTVPASLVAATRYYPNDDPGDEPWNRNGHINKYSAGKRSLALDLAVPEGIEALERLVRHADVLIENYSPRVMANFGLTDERLHELNDELLIVTMPGYGRSGPCRDWLAYGTTLDSHGGLSHCIGYPDAHPHKGGIAWPDPMGGLHAAGALLVALVDLLAGTAAGQTVEVAQFESLVNVMGIEVVRAQLAGADPKPLGSRHRHHAPQGTYRCAGHDAWLSLTVTTEDEWRALCRTIDAPPQWVGFDRQTRLHRHDEIDAALSAFTASRPAMELEATLQRAAIPAAAVRDAGQVLADPQLAQRGLFVTFDQPGAGPFTAARTPIRIDGAFPAVDRAPRLGEHNEEVLHANGFSAAEIAELTDRNVIATRPPW